MTAAGAIAGLPVSRVGLGCNNFGRALDADGTRRVVGAALDAGITFFDTASNYGGGRSEALLGAALGRDRDRVVIATKFGVPVPGVDGSAGAAPATIRRMVVRSLRALRTDRIDLYQLHMPDPDTPLDDTLATLDDLVRAGTVRAVGCSNLDAGQMRAAAALSADAGLTAFASAQVQYSLVHRAPETDGVAAACDDLGMALIPYYPLASGLLTGKVRRGQQPTGRLAMDRYQRFLTDDNFAVAEGLRGFAAERGITMVDVAIGWLAAQPQVPTVIAGATSVDQVAANAAAGRWRPTADDLAVIDRLAPAAAARRPPASRATPTSGG